MNLPLDDWCKIESGDMFQLGSIAEGFDADDAAFCFSYYKACGKGYWFQLDLDKIKLIAKGEKLTIISVREA